MAKIVIEIDCGKEWCGKCRFVAGQLTTPFCDYFNSVGVKSELQSVTNATPKKWDDFETKQYDYFRLPECLAAEVKG